MTKALTDEQIAVFGRITNTYIAAIDMWCGFCAWPRSA